MHDDLTQRTRRTLDQLRSELLDRRTDDGHWIGCLSASSLSTATAVSALAATIVSKGPDASDELHEMVVAGMAYLRDQQNEDGGFGDTDRSHSNIATSYLVLAASALADRSLGQPMDAPALTRLEHYIKRGGGIEGLRRRYGTDKTFVVPIMTNMAIAGLIAWDDVAALPFEAAVFPQSMYRFLRMPVVSYAIPALVAIGQARHFRGRRAIWPLRKIRSAAVAPTMKVLSRMQPSSGGYLEATPLTSFVVMSLAATGRADHDVCRHGLRFLSDSMSSDGSWPIDTNLATWVTSLAIEALSTDPDDRGSWCVDSLVKWHLSCQHLKPHPFTGTDPGGWGWTDLAGAVPDGDDTPGAILALSRMRSRINDPSRIAQIDEAIAAGQRWLLKLQNGNGGWPTFCRGWGKLPFDRSSTDLTAHAIRAIDSQSRRSVLKATKFLVRSQRSDGCWLPLWFGNQDRPDEDNPVYGTSKVLLATPALLSVNERMRPALQKAVNYLIENQNSDGGWGGGESVSRYWGGGDSDEPVISTIEETAVAVEALCTAQMAGLATDRDKSTAGGNDGLDLAIIAGVEFLLRSVLRRRHDVAWPIGFYFAKLWYHEQLYPLIFTVGALGKVLQRPVGSASPAFGSVFPTDPTPSLSHQVPPR